MVLFFVSLFLTILTGFFVTSIFERKEFIKIFLYFMLVTGASVVGTVEILSLFSAITPLGILGLNLLTTFISGYFWFKSGRPVFSVSARPFLKRVKRAVLRDKYLLVLGCAFVFMCAVSVFLVAIMPVVSGDASSYHVLRSTLWISAKNLSHPVIADIRNVLMPINSEILYLWVILLTKKLVWLGTFSFIGFMMSMFSLYGIMSNMKLSEERKLWVLFILASLPSVVILSSGTETDIIIAGLVLSGMYLFWEFAKKGGASVGYFSSLAFALAIGTKTTSFFLLPAVGLWCLWISHLYNGRKFLTPILKIIGFGAVNVLLFSVYNYILNFLEFGNVFGFDGFTASHKNLNGFRGACSYFIKHMFMFFDFSGFTWNETLGKHILVVRDNILNALSLSSVPDGLNSGDSTVANRTLLEPNVGMGILGFLTLLPCLFFSLIKPLFGGHGRKKVFIFSFALLLLLTIIMMSWQLVYMTFSIRFLTSFCVVAAPILAYSYTRKNNPYKFLVTCFALFGLLLVSTHIWARPFGRIVTYLRSGASITEVRQVAQCSMFGKTYPHASKAEELGCTISRAIKTYVPDTKILYFSNVGESLLNIKMLERDGYHIDFASMEEVDKIDFSKYNIILIRDDCQYLSYVRTGYRAPYYSVMSGQYCKYLQKNIDGKPVVGVAICRFEPKFYEARNLKESIFVLTPGENNNVKKYIFYENRNNPPKKQK